MSQKKLLLLLFVVVATVVSYYVILTPDAMEKPLEVYDAVICGVKSMFALTGIGLIVAIVLHKD